MTMRVLVGLVILAAGVAACWAIVAVGQAHALAWITAIIGTARAGGDPPMVETVFNVIIFVPLILVALAGGLIDRRNPLAPGRRALANLPLGLLVGLGGLAASVLYAWLAGAMADNGPTGASASLLAWGAGVIALQVGAEEIYFRGWLQPALAARWGQAAGIAAASLAFGALHVVGASEPLSAISLVNLFLGGLLFGLLAARSGGLAAAIGAHFAWNAAEQLGWGLDPNPGLGSFGAIVDKELVAAPLWGGSGEGLNGSLGMTIALLAIVVPLILLSWGRLPVPTARAARPVSRPSPPGSGRSGPAPA